jgi:hypothetical protein
MKMLGALLRTLVSLFVDDGALALQIITVIVITGISAAILPGDTLAAGGVLLVGCLAVLFANALATRQRTCA